MHLIVFFTQEKNMISEYESHHLVKLQNGIETSDQKPSERIIVFKIIYDNLKSIVNNGMMPVKDRQKILKSQFFLIFMRLAEFFVYFLYYTVVDHSRFADL